MVLGALLGYAGGASAAARALAWLGGGGAGDQIAGGLAGVMIIGPLCALVGAAVGYRRGRVADFSRRSL